jgi:hypothetical protein
MNKVPSAPTPSSAPVGAASNSASNNTNNANDNGYRLPENNTLQHAAKLAVVEDRPIMMDYWASSLEKKVLIGVKEDKEKLLVKSEDEYTSPISKIYKVGKEYIIMTENSIYIVDAEIPTKRISA